MKLLYYWKLEYVAAYNLKKVKTYVPLSLFSVGTESW